MATRERIEMDFRQAMRQADEVDEIASSLSRLADDKLEGSLITLASGWTGENANAYIKKGQALEGRINASAGDLRQVAEAIRSAARRIYEAEMTALAIASD